MSGPMNVSPPAAKPSRAERWQSMPQVFSSGVNAVGAVGTGSEAGIGESARIDSSWGLSSVDMRWSFQHQASPRRGVFGTERAQRAHSISFSRNTVQRKTRIDSSIFL